MSVPCSSEEPRNILPSMISLVFQMSTNIEVSERLFIFLVRWCRRKGRHLGTIVLCTFRTTANARSISHISLSLSPSAYIFETPSQVIPSLELIDGSSGDFMGKARQIESTHFFGVFDGCV